MTADPELLGAIRAAGVEYRVHRGDASHPLTVWRDDRRIAAFPAEYLDDSAFPPAVWDPDFLRAVSWMDSPPTWRIRCRAVALHRRRPVAAD